MIENRIHIFGASGSGTTTLGKYLSEKLDIEHFDTDDFFWVKSSPPYQKIVPTEERKTNLNLALQSCKNWVLSGSLCGWGDFSVLYFTKVVFLYIPNDIRMERLKKREIARYGASIFNEEHPMHKTHKDFIAWASKYDDAGLEMRSKLMHEEWMKALPIKAIKIEGETHLKDSVDMIVNENY